MKKVAVLQSNYIPWKGYFDIIHDVDLFVYYDEVQYTKGDWRNRNKLKTIQGLKWITIPVGADEHRFIDEVKINDQTWRKKHYDMIKNNYSKAPYFQQYKELLEYIYREKQWEYLFELNRFLIEHICQDYLGIRTEFSDSRQYGVSGHKHEKLLHLVKAAGADLYISGPAAKDYIIAEDYKKCAIDLQWKDYSGYPEYPQRFGAFEHNVSILDLLFNTGPDAPYYIWGWREECR